MNTSGQQAGPGLDLNIWLGREASAHEDPAFGRLAEALQCFQNRVAGSRPPSEVCLAAASELEVLTSVLAEYVVPEAIQVAGRQLTRPARGQTFLPPIRVDAYDREHLEARVTFTRFYLGSNGAAHGGAIALLFDDLLGQLANAPGQPRARTAYLRTDYRSIVPIDRELVVTARTTRVEGRKLFIDGEIRDGGRILSEATGLFVRLQEHHE
jgi:acyl-coenzyme A thioesterase PaaI-like protein